MASNPSTSEKMTCEMCSEHEVNWKCENCNKLGCNRCTSDHMIKPSPLGHMIISIRSDGLSDIKTELNSQCKMHPKETYQRYCEMCDYLVCFECALSGHSQHKLCSIPEIVQKKRAEYEGILLEIRKSSIPALTEIIQNFKQGQEDYKTGIQTLVEEISNRAEKLKMEVDQIKELLIKDLKEQQRLDLEMLKANQETYEKKLAHIKCNMELCEGKLESAHGIDLLVALDRMKGTLEECRKSVAILTVAEPPPFLMAPTNQKELQKIFGNLDVEREIENTSDDADIPAKVAGNSNVKVISKFDETGPVTCIAANNQDAWILSSGNLSLTRKDGSKEKSFQVDFHINDMAVSVFGELLVTDRIGKRIKRLLENGKFVDWVDMKCEPHGICICSDGKVIVGCVDGEEMNILNQYGRVLAKFGTYYYVEKGGSGRDYDYIRRAYHIAVNENGDVAVCQALSHNNWDILVLDKINKSQKLEELELRFVYKKNCELIKPLSPQAITFTGQHLLVTDYFNSVVHEVDEDGNFFRFLMTEEDGLHGPIAIDVDKSGHVWIGCSNGTVFVVKIKK